MSAPYESVNLASTASPAGGEQTSGAIARLAGDSASAAPEIKGGRRPRRRSARRPRRMSRRRSSKRRSSRRRWY